MLRKQALKNLLETAIFPEDLVILLTVLGISSLLASFIPALSFVIELTLPGLALGLSEIYLAETIVGKLTRKFI